MLFSNVVPAASKQMLGCREAETNAGQRKGFMVDGHVFLCSGQKEAAWAAMKTIAESSDEWRQ